ncbi:MAG: DUF1697 domain-containing protein [Acidobacteriota bacterium]
MAIQYLAFLRAVNVGGRVVKMTELIEVFEGLRFADVATFIASGNVIFRSSSADATKLEKKIERALAGALGYPVATFVRTSREVAAVAEYQPFGNKALAGATVFIAFLSAAPTAEAMKKILSFRSATDDFHLHGRELYWLCRTGLRESKFSGAVLEKAAKMPATLRNATTVRKLAAKYPPA